jgi:RNA methyltransferase, TrmH family
MVSTIEPSVDRISSRHNPVAQRFRALARGAATREDEAMMLLDGPHLVEEALVSGVALDTVAFAERHLPGRFDTLAAQVATRGVRAVVVTDQVLAAMSPVQQPSGVVAIGRRHPASLEEVLARHPQLIVLLADIQDPGNVGAIIRAAEACGATGVVPGETTADPLSWKALRGGMGSTFRLPVAGRQPLEAVARRTAAAGIRLLAAVPRGGTPLPECDLQRPSAVLLGGEGAGLPAGLVRLADARVTIPMRPPVESLNVAIAAALLLYEASRQRADAPRR